jgi:ABC-type Fe3+-hydroxamate transport system substrate-binding protein
LFESTVPLHYELVVSRTWQKHNPKLAKVGAPTMDLGYPNELYINMTNSRLEKSKPEIDKEFFSKNGLCGT